ncbi:uroporphyrinogen-III synthase [Rhizobium sp. ARZ01]|uniref:uroporphyrinogen-III synthase n=1 Tax=Rhizobium sp. ARZ01 TaxID=2769313 RepID=UPI00178282C7|nr:uroporphyrinogen-III synthase [Rhizobium sp. ARZ01]MBD9374799.1 uroporphyrinogen-III synthase [Rhizobium sp. ARZ01]
MRILVVRPHASAKGTAARLTALGHTPIVVPLAEPVHDKEAALAALSTHHSAIAITSSEAARVLLSIGDALDRHLLTTVFAVGRTTARSATAAGFRTVLSPGAGDGNSLADLIIAHRRDYGVPPDPLLYLAGMPRSKHFEARLDAAGVAYETTVCYRMEPIRPKSTEMQPILVDQKPDAILFYSRESARHFFELPLVIEHMNNLERTLFLCISGSVATAVPQRFAKSVVVAAAPTEENLLDLL